MSVNGWEVGCEYVWVWVCVCVCGCERVCDVVIAPRRSLPKVLDTAISQLTQVADEVHQKQRQLQLRADDTDAKYAADMITCSSDHDAKREHALSSMMSSLHSLEAKIKTDLSQAMRELDTTQVDTRLEVRRLKESLDRLVLDVSRTDG